jgi:RimJ/RimL family protein N-acetyltransferase
MQGAITMQSQSNTTLNLGEGITYRKLVMGDAETFEAHLRTLDPASRRMRFGMMASDAFLAQYAERCISLNAIIHGAFHHGSLIGVAELRPIGTVRMGSFLAAEAEIAFSVLMEWRNHGIGTTLFARTLRSARNRGYSRLYMTCLRHNAPMQALARKFSAEIMVEIDESVAYVETPRRTIISLFREAMEDAGIFGTMAMEWQRRALERRATLP